MRWFVDSVRVRLTVVVSLIFGLALSLAATGLIRQVEAALINDVRVRNDTVAQALGQMLASSQGTLRDNAGELEGHLPGTVDRSVVREGLNEGLVYVQGPGAASVVDSSNLFERLRRVVTGEAVPLFGKTMPERIDSDKYAVSQVKVATIRGPVSLSVASPLDPIHRTVDRVQTAMLIAVPTLVAAVALMTWMMTGQALRPVSAITGRVREITGSTLDARVPEPRTDDEIGDLARTMNAMLDRLESSAERQRRFMSDASHELRSPVAAIRAQLETALLHPENAEWESISRTVLDEDERLGALVDNMLVLARLEEDARPPAAEVDVDDIVHNEVARPLRVPVDRSGVLAGRVNGVAGELSSVVRNLLDNAARHARSLVRVSLTTHGDVVRLTVEDDGPGIAPEMRKVVFERFTRLEEARTRDAGGSGLGLALSKRIVQSHHGHIWVESSGLGGAAFIVELPSADAEGAPTDD